jgi:hypothetical protein
MKNFSREQLNRSTHLVGDVEAHRWEANAMKENERLLLCQYWVCEARALLEEKLDEPNHQACRWVLGVVRAIADAANQYVHGLSGGDRPEARRFGRGWRDRLLDLLIASP